jgi:hypothetical protein
VIFGNENEFVFFSFFSIESDLGPNLSRFRVDAERLGLANVLVVHFEKVPEQKKYLLTFLYFHHAIDNMSIGAILNLLAMTYPSPQLFKYNHGLKH